MFDPGVLISPYCESDAGSRRASPTADMDVVFVTQGAAAAAGAPPLTDADPSSRHLPASSSTPQPPPGAQVQQSFESRYESACLGFGVEPSGTLQISQDQGSLALSGKACGERGVRALAEALRGRSYFHSIAVRDSFMGCAGAVALCDALCNSPSPPKRVDLTGGNVRGRGAAALAQLIEATPLEELILEWNGVASDPDAFKELMRAAAASPTLSHLDLRHNHIGSAECDPISEMLCFTRSLTCLDLRWNQITHPGSARLASGAGSCGSLLALHLSGNTVEPLHLSAINEKLRDNSNWRIRGAKGGGGGGGGAPPSPTPGGRRSPPPLRATSVVSPGRQSRLHWAASPQAQRQFPGGHIMSPPSPPSGAVVMEAYIPAAGGRTSPPPPGGGLDPRSEALQQRNQELAAELAGAREFAGELQRRLEEAELGRVASTGRMQEHADEARILQARVEHLEGLNRQVEEVVRSRDAAMSLLRDKAAGYQHRLEQLVRLSDGRCMDDVVKELQEESERTLESDRKRLLLDSARAQEMQQQRYDEDIAMLKHELNSAHNRLALQSQRLEEGADEVRQWERKVADEAQVASDAEERYDQLLSAAEAERRQLLQRVEELQAAGRAGEERCQDMERRLQEERAAALRGEASMQLEKDRLASLARDDRSDILRKLTVSRDANEALQEEVTNLKSELRRMKDDQQAFKERLERRVQEQMNSLLETYSTPLQVLAVG